MAQKKPALPSQGRDQKTLVLLDAHAIIHRAYHALPEFLSSKGEPTGALYGLSSMLMKIITDLKPDYIAACYDLPQKTFRHEAYEAYKAGRAKANEALIFQLKNSRKIFEAFNIPIYDSPGFEADDLLGTIVKKLGKDKNIQIIIASGDMDTIQLVDDKKVQVYTLKKGINDTILYDEDAVVARFGFKPKLLPDYKGLRGDPSDNIIGVKGIGEKTATILIQNFGTIENIYKELEKNPSALLKAGVSERIIHLLQDNKEEAIFSKALAFIRFDAPIDFSLPDETWKESFDIEKVKALFREFEFRSLIERVDKNADLRGPASPKLKRGESDADLRRSGLAETVSAITEIDPVEVEKVGIALWLLDSNRTTPSLKDILEYAGTEFFKKAKEKILKEITEKKLEQVYKQIELPLLPIIKKTEERGVLLDTKYLEKLGKEYREKLNKLEKEIYELSGEEFNINSSRQLGEILFDHLKLSIKGLKKTAGGVRSTRESELLKLKGAHPIIEKILSYRELQKILSTYIEPLPKLVDKDNRLHTHLNQAGTTTGRMSSNNPNLQNIPVHGNFGETIRKAFIATPGYKWIASDYSQIEMRLLALFSEDERFQDIFKKGEDIHSAVASFVFGVPESAVTALMRRKAKTINFGIIYGMGVDALRESLGISKNEAQIFYNNFFKTFPKIREYFDKIKHNAAITGYTETLFGRRRYFPAMKSKVPYLVAMAGRQAQNAPLQGTAADITKIAMRKIDEELKALKLDDKVFLLLQVHDELIYEAKVEVAEKTIDLIKRVMENTIESKLPFTVNTAIGDNWAELE